MTEAFLEATLVATLLAALLLDIEVTTGNAIQLVGRVQAEDIHEGFPFQDVRIDINLIARQFKMPLGPIRGANDHLKPLGLQR